MSRQIPSTTEVFLLSGMTGSFRYMAPEVANSLYYNQRCDVYSFSLLLWEMLMLQRPYDNFPDQEVFMRKVFQQNTRPTIPKKWSRSLRALLAAGWSADQDHRLDMSILRSMLRAEVMHCKDGDETTLKGDSFLRRSTHVYVFKEEKRPVIHAPAGFEASGTA
jgi:serine/threonine protein kinase